MAEGQGWHAGPERDFVGYGRRTPQVRWPGDASERLQIPGRSGLVKKRSWPSADSAAEVAPSTVT